MSLYGYPDPNPSQIELDNRKLALKAAEEGIVLLKNDNALPIKSKKIALYGVGVRLTCNCGLGSGSLESRHDIKIEEGFRNLGFEISTQKWLDDYDNEHKNSYNQFREIVESKIVGMTNPMQVIPTVRSYVYTYPSGRAITNEDIQESNTDTAIYVLTRQAGEGNDRKLKKGDYYITDIEKENLEILTKSYTNTILVINSGGLIDMSFLDNITNIKAIVHYVQAGEEGGNALANLLSGKVNFSGKLVDTIPLHYEDIPFGNEYSHLNGQLENEYYKEGIYVGYRYYDSFQKNVRFPFGFGLSYTKFKIETELVKIDRTKVSITVKVTNIGSFDGKEVVQVYVSVPGHDKEFQRLVGYAKTNSIKPESSEKVQISFDLSHDCTSYSQKEAAWKLDSGFYIVRVGNSSRSTKVTAKIEIKKSVIILQCKNCCQCTDDFEELFSNNEQEQGNDDESTEIFSIESSSFSTQKVDYTQPKITETEEEKTLLDSLTTEDQIELLIGADLTKQVPGSFEIIAAAGKTANTLISKGLRNIIMSDGPAGISIIDSVCYKAKTESEVNYETISVPTKCPESFNWGLFGQYISNNVCSKDGIVVYRPCTSWPVEVVLAQTWNNEILKSVGSGFGSEMLKYGISVILAPAMNIHKNPLCGRTFEYFSEDPFLTGKMAASFVEGVQGCGNAAACLKHLCCNNCEDGRQFSSSNVSERALREIYLKGFEIAVRKSQPKTVMSSYNLLNHVYTADRKDLLDDILRCEWKFNGLVMTDWNSCGEKNADPCRAVLAGNDLIMPGQNWCKNQIRDAFGKGQIKNENIRLCAGRVLRLILNGVTESRIKKIE